MSIIKIMIALAILTGVASAYYDDVVGYTRIRGDIMDEFTQTSTALGAVGHATLDGRFVGITSQKNGLFGQQVIGTKFLEQYHHFNITTDSSRVLYAVRDTDDARILVSSTSIDRLKEQIRDIEIYYKGDTLN